jgi:BON domain
VRRDRQLSGLEIVGWTTLGVLSGIVAGFGLSEWIGAVTRRRLTRLVANRPLRAPRPPLTAAATARAACAALDADPALAELALEATPVAVGVVELHGWVPSRAIRAYAGRVARGVPGIERVVNRLLVDGEDDRDFPRKDRPTNQTA